MVQGLWYVSAFAGFIMILGGVIMISKRILVLDSQTGEVSTEISLPFGIKLKTNLPVILMLALGVVLLLIPIWLANEREKILTAANTEAAGQKLRRISLRGPITYPEPVKVFVIAAEKADALNEVNLEVPLSRCGYTVSYWCANGARKLGEETINLTGDETDRFFKLKGYSGSSEPDPLCKLQTVRQEAPNVTAEFNRD